MVPLRDHQVAHSSSPSDHISSSRTIADYYKQSSLCTSSSLSLSLAPRRSVVLSLFLLPARSLSLSPSHSRLVPGSVFQPHRDSTSGPTYHWRSINISDRLAPTSQECDTARNSFELHISLSPAK